MQLTTEQVKSLDRGEIVTFNLANIPCVILREDVFRRAQEAAEQVHEELRAQFANNVQVSDWNDTVMDVYDSYEVR